jgi:hypothetical protein
MESNRSAALRLSTGGRFLVGTLAVGTFIAGVVAVLTDTGIAGSVALLLVGAVLLLIALLGSVPERAEFGGSKIEFTKETLYAEQTQAKVAEAIVDQDSPANRRETIADLIVDLNERFAQQVGVLPDSAKEVALQAYTTSIRGVLSRILPPTCSVEVLEEGKGLLDFVIHGCGEGDVYVGGALGLSTTDTRMPPQMLEFYLEQARIKQRLLIITNRPPTDVVYLAPAQGGRNYRPITVRNEALEIVKWTNPDDDRTVSAALQRLMGVPARKN